VDGWLIRQRALFDRRGPGNTCLSSLKAMTRIGERAQNNSKGCGGVMRVAPVGMDAATEGPYENRPDLPGRVLSMGADIAALTHGHPTGQLSAGVMAAVVYLLLGGMRMRQSVVLATAELRKYEGHEETLAALEHAVRLADARPGRSDVLRGLGAGWVAEEALAMGVYCALGAEDFESGVVLAVNHGGDSDSTGSIAGNLLGARFGAESIPERWLGPLELREVISALADDLATSPEWRLDSYENTPESDFYWRRYPGW
jgi:ADP-ribosylglycohydrolase